LLHNTKLQVIVGFMVMGVGMGFMLVSMIHIIIQSVRQGETGIATAMNTLFRTAGGVIGPTIASVFLAEYVSPLVIQTPRGPIPGPLLPNATAFNYIFLTALAISLVGVLVTLFVTSRAAEIEA
jgi:MFS family permease